jgi:hypothetical protein
MPGSILCDHDQGKTRFSLVDQNDANGLKCVYWGGQTTDSNTVNVGQPRANFKVAIAGSNGYVTTKIATPAGYNTGLYYGKNAINAPYDAQGYNTFMGSKIFTGIWNVDQCAAYCKSQSDYNTATAPKDGTPAKVCKFFNTYLLTAKMANGDIKPQGQYCSLYTEAWPEKYATNGGQWRGKDQYTIDYSFGYAKTDAGIDPLVGDANGAAYQAVADIKWSSLQPFCSTYLGYSNPVSTITATATSTPISTSTSYSTTTVAAMPKRDLGSKFPGLTTDASVGGSVLTDGNNVTWYSEDIPIRGPGNVGSKLAKRATSVAVPAGLAKYQPLVISSACSMLVKPASSTSVLTASTTVTGVATTTLVTVVSTVTAQARASGQLIMAVPKAKWTQTGFPQGSAPLEMYGSDGDYDLYAYSNLHNHPWYAADTVASTYTLDTATGHLRSNLGGGLTAAAYNVNIDSQTMNAVVWMDAALLAHDSSYYAPLICTRSTQTGQLSCSITSRTDPTQINSNLIGYQQDNVGYSYLGISGSAVPNDRDPDDVADATLTLY